jgi:hypothetical protein
LPEPAEIDVETTVAREREVRDREAEAYDTHREREQWLVGVEDACVLDYFAFTTGEFRALLGDAGFGEIEIGAAGVLPLLSRRLGLGLGVQRRLSFTPLGRLLADYVVARAVRPA